MRQHYEEQNLDMPADFFPPALLPQAPSLLAAFQKLTDDRPLAIGMTDGIYGRISFVSIERYAARYGFDEPDLFLHFHRVIWALDTIEVVRLNAKANRPT